MHHFITQKMNQLIENVISYKNNDPLLACLKSTTSSKYSRDTVWKIEVIQWVLRCEIQGWGSRAAEIWGSCTLGLGPLNLSCTGAPSACLSAGLSASCWLLVRLRCPSRRGILTSPSWLAFRWPTVNGPRTQERCHLERGASLSLFSPVCSQRYCLYPPCANRHTHAHLRGCKQCVEWAETTVDSRFSPAPSQTTGRQTHLFFSVQRWESHVPLCKVCTHDSPILIMDVYSVIL